jgi:hypothetical protein
MEELDWKIAAKHLKKIISSCRDSSIDTYFQRREINTLRDRYNKKERTRDLYNAIMTLREV